jgi:hypothetical protein
MPILGENDVLELSRDGVDDRNYLIAFGDGQGIARHEVVLDVDDEEGVVGLEWHGHGSLIVPLERA